MPWKKNGGGGGEWGWCGESDNPGRKCTSKQRILLVIHFNRYAFPYNFFGKKNMDTDSVFEKPEKQTLDTIEAQ